MIQLLTALAATIAATAAAPAPQTEADGYTRYELLGPDSHKFRILYDITATTAGATRYFNPIRPGSIASDESVTDAATGAPLAFREVDGSEAIGVRGAKPGNRFIAVTLARPVPAGGGGRIRIDKTYTDPASYRQQGDTIVFERSLGIARNAVVLPPGYELTACNVPSQVLQQTDGRIAVSFWNASGAPAPLHLEARPAALAVSKRAGTISERAAQTRNIVYYLEVPETHSFRLTHDYTETRPGRGVYVNIVRAGSIVSDPSARDLDTGAAIPHELLKGAAIKALEPDAEGITDATTAVVFRFTPVAAGASRRLRITETYTDPARYGVESGELVWHRSFGRPANAVVLPAGWGLTHASVPATVSRTDDGRLRLDFINPRGDEIDVLITASRRAP
ncbi:hypothetical protein IP88_05235 [alpha proteobacterium AAP81b]|nr:hypothetical protein IP88_05235 [alpha proteobacterium AAP81b]